MPALIFDELKNKYKDRPKKDEEVTCKLLMELDKEYLVEINNEWEGIIPAKHLLPELKEDFLNFNELEALIISGPNENDRYIVSLKACKQKNVWQELEACKNEGKMILVKITKPIKGGAEVYIEGVRAFIPGRYLKLQGISMNEWRGKEVPVYVAETNHKERKIILNHKLACEDQRNMKVQHAIKTLKVGDIVKAKVLRMTDFGVFIDVDGYDGFVPRSELCWSRFNHPKEVIRIGEEVKAQVLRIEEDKQRVAFSLKKLMEDPWQNVHNEFGIGIQIEGRVVSIAKFGVFVEIKPGVEALLHKNEMKDSNSRIKIGDSIRAKISSMDMINRKINLTQKEPGGENNSKGDSSAN